jgi:hypothetical protein
MPDELETILRLVADGHLTPEEAAPIIEALNRGGDRERPRSREGIHDAAEDTQQGAEAARRAGSPAREASRSALGGRSLRIRVSERGRQVVNLRIPVTFAEMAGRMVPGLGAEHFERIRDAIEAGASGPILDIEDDGGDGVLISLE